jgi:MFS family permease
MLQAGEPVGVAIAAIAGFVLMPHVGWRAIMIGSSATAILALVIRRSIHLPNEPAARHVTLRELHRARVGKLLACAWLLGVFKLGTYWTCYTWLPSFLQNEMHQSVGRSTAWVLTAQAGQLVGMLTFGAFSDRLGRRVAFTTYSILTAVSLAPLAFAWTWLSAHPAAFWTAMLGLGFGSGCTAGFGALLAELFPTEVRGAAMGTAYNLARAAQLGAPAPCASRSHAPASRAASACRWRSPSSRRAGSGCSPRRAASPCPPSARGRGERENFTRRTEGRKEERIEQGGREGGEMFVFRGGVVSNHWLATGGRRRPPRKTPGGEG